MKTNVAESVNDDIIALWKRQRPTPELWPMLYEDFKTDGLLTVGLNPSFSEDGALGWCHLKNDDRLEVVSKSPRAFFTWNPSDCEKFNRSLALLVEETARKDHQFFRAIPELIKQINEVTNSIEWHHVDLFFTRKTDHTKLNGLLFKRVKDQVELSEFGESQFKLFERLLEAGKPRAVVIYNSLASSIYRLRRLKDKKKDRLGCYFDEVGGREVPVFFSGFPTYMDRYSRERLDWHILYVLRERRLLAP